VAYKIFQVDAFTDRPFAGNPAAVVLLEGPRTDGWMQDVAREMNLSETAFVLKEEGGFGLRWFTPTMEVELCGHATLATAHVLFEDGGIKPDEAVRFNTRSGALTAALKDGWIELDFPAEPALDADPPEGISTALGAEPVYVGRSRFDYLVEISGPEVLMGLKPDMGVLKEIPARGFIVTSSPGSAEYDFVSRFFAPASGIPEDPVTGSAHCTLGPFWAARLGKAELTGFQASGRGGVVRVRVGEKRVCLMGRAVTVLRGELSAG
jgi:predicted PhzF superfamily epimerase YddE/YHI9